MKCEEAEMRMAELLAGEIGAGEREALSRHLLDCAACRADFELARAGGRVDWPDAPVPPALVERTRAALRGEPALLKFFRFAASAAAALVVALLAAGSRVERPAPPPPAPAPVAAYVQDAVVGTMVARDEQGRPVGELGLKSHRVSVEVLDGIAKTTVEENFQNHTDRRLEGTFHFPLPPDASISRLALEVNGKIEEGTVVERERARQVFEQIVRKMQDPALLEWMPGGAFKCRVFPIEPRATKRVIVAYTQALPFFRGKMSYVYPLASEKTRAHPPEELRIDLRARFSGRLARIESPSHRADVRRRNEREAEVTFAASNYRPESDFVVALETEDDELRVVSHRPEGVGEEGYFALFVTPRGEPARRPGKYVFVLDLSATVSAPELEVSKRLVRAMMEKAIPGDRFELLAHNVEVESSGEVDLRRANDFMDRLRPVGASDLLKALLAAPEGEIVYIGEGTPTYGETDAAKILEAVKGLRIRTIGGGSDANVELLAKLGGHFRVSPSDDVAKRVAEIAATLGSPPLRGLKVEGEGISEVVGVRDVFYGERLAVTGRFRGPSKLVVTGDGYRREIDAAFPAEEEENNYVRRLWAQRKVADLLAAGKKDEVVALGVRHQIVTPFTSLLVLESEQMWKDYQLKREVQKEDQVLGRKYAPDHPELEKLVWEGLKKSEGMSEVDRRAELQALVRLLADQRDDRLRKLQDLVESRSQSKQYQEVAGPSPTPAEVEKRLVEYKVALEQTKNREAVRPDVPALKVEPSPPDESFGDRTRQLMAEATELYKRGNLNGASSKFEEAFQMQPSSDQVYAYIKRAGDDTVAAMMNHPDRKIQDVGRRLFELAKPGTHMRSGTAVLRQYLAELKHEDHAIWRNSFWHLKNIGPYAAKDLIPALGDTTNDLYRARVILLLTEMGVDGSLAVTEALNSRDPFVRQNAAIVLGNIKDERSLPALAKLLEDPNEPASVKKFAQEAIRKIDRTAPPVTPEERQSAEYRPVREFAERLAGEERAIRDGTPPSPAEIEARGKAVREAYLAQIERTRERVPDPVKPLTPAPVPPVPVVAPPPPPRPEPPVPAPTVVVAPPARPPEAAPTPAPESAELLGRLEEHRAKLAKALSEKTLLSAEVQYARQMAERLQQDLADLEKKHLEMAHDKANLEAKVRHLDSLGVTANPATAPYDPNRVPESMKKFRSAGDRDGKWSDLPSRTRESMISGGKDLDGFPAEYRELLGRYFETNNELGIQTGPILDTDVQIATAAVALDPLNPMRLGARSFIDNDRRIQHWPVNGLDGPTFHKPFTHSPVISGRDELEADAQVSARQLEVQFAQMQELQARVEGRRAELAQALGSRPDLAAARRATEGLKGEVARLEEKHVEMARDKKHLEEKINHLKEMGIRTDIAPRKPLRGKVTAVANEIGLVVISIGKDAGVLENDEFTVHREGEFVAKIVIDRADRSWSAGRVVLKNSDQRVADDVSNIIYASAPRQLSERSSAASPAAGLVTAAEGDRLTLDVGSREGVPKGEVYAITRDSKFVALVLILEVSEAAARGGVWRGIATGRILAGDKAERVGDVGAYLAGLPAEVKAELASRANLAAIRAKMGLRE